MALGLGNVLDFQKYSVHYDVLSLNTNGKGELIWYNP